MIKKTDLAEIFGKPKPGKPLFLHNATKTNHIVQGLGADVLKLASRLCARCNNERSQPYDRAWEVFSHFVRNQLPPVVPGAVVRADRIYAVNSTRELRKVQLYFVKLFGCLIHENEIPIDLGPFAKALLEGSFIGMSSSSSDVCRVRIELSAWLDSPRLYMIVLGKSLAHSGSMNSTALR